MMHQSIYVVFLHFTYNTVPKYIFFDFGFCYALRICCNTINFRIRDLYMFGIETDKKGKIMSLHRGISSNVIS